MWWLYLPALTLDTCGAVVIIGGVASVQWWAVLLTAVAIRG